MFNEGHGIYKDRNLERTFGSDAVIIGRAQVDIVPQWCFQQKSWAVDEMFLNSIVEQSPAVTLVAPAVTLVATSCYSGGYYLLLWWLPAVTLVATSCYSGGYQLLLWWHQLCYTGGYQLFSGWLYYLVPAVTGGYQLYSGGYCYWWSVPAVTLVAPAVTLVATSVYGAFYFWWLLAVTLVATSCYSGGYQLLLWWLPAVTLVATVTPGGYQLGWLQLLSGGYSLLCGAVTLGATAVTGAIAGDSGGY
ncbi:hypothetical protein Baya_16236 [Bagarius yarrelli]|uniref:Uncharacterized protein n=1 Tax=Bagarius yarrelli TaxID=175774 RepID=A0A556VV71_BAGYA|nr:hypothetical protein Baya_16236 [Bagarius yarrelli]